MFEELKHIPEAWAKASRSKSFKNQFFITLVVFIAVMLHNFYCLRMWQGRQGIQINDYILNLMHPVDFSIVIFIMEYCTLLTVFVFTLPYPERLMQAIQMFAITFFARTTSIYFFALEPPKEMIPLMDPIANFFLHSKDTFVTKDLFFSGHVSALALLSLIVMNKYVKRWTMFATVAIGIMIMWQHVHYSADVIIAPIISYICYKFVLYIHRETRYGFQFQQQEA